MKWKDTQVGGGHYKNYKIEPMEFFLANNIPWCEAEIIKYVVRWRNKGGIQDLEKARHVLDALIEYQKENENKKTTSEKTT